MEPAKMGLALLVYLANSRGQACDAGLRYLVKTLPRSIKHIHNLDLLLLEYVGLVSIDLMPGDFRSSLPANPRLVERTAKVLRLLELHTIQGMCTPQPINIGNPKTCRALL